jgi:hypothetical protein
MASAPLALRLRLKSFTILGQLVDFYTYALTLLQNTLDPKKNGRHYSIFFG